ncbi:MAG: AAA family ATPase [Thermoguttaceae bacterium]
MRIEEFHIEGFGWFHNLSVAALHPRLSVVLGKNEAGKSTLLAFLRSVLFGFPARRQEEFYPPLHGGRHGGRIVLVDGHAQRIVAERFAGRGQGRFAAVLPDGSPLGEEQFHQRLGMVAGDVYGNVFAFGLGELETFKTLQSDKIRDAVYNAGMGAGGQSPGRAIQKLSDRCELLFKPGGSNPEMNQILKRLVERREKIDQHRTDQDEYRRLQDELHRANTEIADIGSALHRCRHRLTRLHALQQARGDWIALLDARKQLQSLPRIESFPQDGVSRMDALLSEQRSLRNQLREITDEKREADERLAALRVDETLLLLVGEIRRLERSIDLYEENRRQLAAAGTQRKLAEEQLTQGLQELGEEWNEEKLRGFDLSIPTREEIDSVRQGCEEARKSVERQATEVGLREKQLPESRELERNEREKLERLAGPAANLDADGIRRLAREQTAYQAARRDLPRVQQELLANQDRFQENLRSIGPDWNEERLRRFDDSLAAREALNIHRDRLNDLRSRCGQWSGRVEDARQSVRECEADVERDEASLAALPEAGDADETSLNDRKNRLRGLRALMARQAQLTADTSHQEERQRDF